MELTKSKALRSESFTLTDTEPRLKLPYLPVGVGVYNKDVTPADVLVNPYTGDVITIEPQNYRELPISSSEFKLLTPGEVVITTFFTQTSVEGQRPVYPGFGAPQGTVNPYQYRDGFFYTPVSSRINTSSVAVSELSVYEIMYFVMGDMVATTTETYQETLVGRVMDKLIQARASGYFQDVTSLYEAMSLPINKEYIGGASLVERYDTHLAHTTVQLSRDLTRYAFIFQTLGCALSVNGGQATVRVAAKDDFSDAETVMVGAGAPTTLTRPVRYFEVQGTLDPGQEITLTFSGHKAQVLQHAPFLNIYYPIGMVPGESDPINFKPWLDEQDEFLRNLKESLFTGRVVFYRESPQETDHRAVWNGDFITYNVLISEWKILDPERRAHYPLFNFEPPSYRDPLFIDRTSRSARSEKWREREVMTEQSQRIFEKLYIFDGPYALGRLSTDTNGERGNHQRHKVAGSARETFSYSSNDDVAATAPAIFSSSSNDDVAATSPATPAPIIASTQRAFNMTLQGTPGQVFRVPLIMSEPLAVMVTKYGSGGIRQDQIRVLGPQGQVYAQTPVDDADISPMDSSWGCVGLAPAGDNVLEITAFSANEIPLVVGFGTQDDWNTHH